MTLTRALSVAGVVMLTVLLAGMFNIGQFKAEALTPEVCYFSSTDSIAVLPEAACEAAGGAFIVNACDFFAGNTVMLGLLAELGIECAGGGGGGGGEEDPLPQCADTTDNDGDGLIDFLMDPGCSSPLDNDETNASEPELVENTLALCTDGQDNDSDEQTDLADSDCASFMPKLTVTKIVVNDNGGVKEVVDFALFVNGATTTSGTEMTVQPGSYTITETTDANYDASFGGSCDSSGVITLVAGDVRGCTITNNDKAPNTPPPSGGGGSPTSGGGGSSAPGNGPIAGSFGINAIIPGGTVLGASTSSLPQAPVSCDMYLTEFLKSGQENNPEQVKRLQSVLKDMEGAALEINGIFDAATLTAVHAFQMKYASDVLTPWNIKESTGFVYLTTRKKINELYCRSLREFPLTQQELEVIAEVASNPSQGSQEAAAAMPSSQGKAAEKAAPKQDDDQVKKEEAKEDEGQEGGSRVWNAVTDFLGRLFNRAR